MATWFPARRKNVERDLRIFVLLVSIISSCKGIPIHENGAQETKYEVENIGEEQIGQYATIITALENLGVLESSHRKCYSFDDLVKTREQLADGVWKIGVYFYVREHRDGEDGGDGDGNEAGEVTGEGGNSGKGAEPGRTGKDGDCIDTHNSGGLSLIALPTKSSGTGVVKAHPSVDADKVDEEPVVVNTTGRSHRANGTSSISLVGTATSDDEAAGLSRTQIMVIATCSTVIGLFFIVALTMRVRNYVKRVRVEQANSRRLTYRSSSFGNREGSLGADQLRGSITNSKASLHHSGSTGIPIDEDFDSPPSSKKNMFHENKPLLVITSSSAPSSPTFEHAKIDGAIVKDRKISEEYNPLFQEDDDFPLTGDHNANFDAFHASDHALCDIEEITETEDDEDDDEGGVGIDHVTTVHPVDVTRAGPTLLNLTGPNEVARNLPAQNQERLLDYSLDEDPYDGSREIDKLQRETSGDQCLADDNSKLNLHSSEFVGYASVAMEPDSSLYSIASAGLTQSDSSIGSYGNGGYRYGNQEEYTGSPSFNVSEFQNFPNNAVTTLDTRSPGVVNKESECENDDQDSVRETRLASDSAHIYAQSEDDATNFNKQNAVIRPSNNDIAAFGVNNQTKGVADFLNQNEAVLDNHRSACPTGDETNEDAILILAENINYTNMCASYGPLMAQEPLCYDDLAEDCAFGRDKDEKEEADDSTPREANGNTVYNSVSSSSSSPLTNNQPSRKRVTFSLSDDECRFKDKCACSEDDDTDPESGGRFADHQEDGGGKKRRTGGTKEEKRFLLGPDFEGMQPTFV